MAYLSYDSYDDADFADLIGKKLVKVEKNGSDEIHFYTEDGEHYLMHHYQDCCESVYIDYLEAELGE